MSLSALRNEKILKARQRELHAHGEYDQSHKLRPRIVQKPTSCTRPPPGQKHHHDPHSKRTHRDSDEYRHRKQQLGMGDSEGNDAGDRTRAGGEQDQRCERWPLVSAIPVGLLRLR